MASPESAVSKSEFARICNVSPGRVTQWISEGKISGAALVGHGRGAKIVVALAQRQVGARTDSGQAFGNGLKTNLRASERREPPASTAPAGIGGEVLADPAASSLEKLDTRIKQERLEALERANRKAAEDEAAAQGRYVSAAATKRQMTTVVAQTMRIFEGAIPEIASAIAAELKIEERDVIPVLNREFRKVREQASQTHRRLADETPPLLEDRAEAPEA